MKISTKTHSFLARAAAAVALAAMHPAAIRAAGEATAAAPTLDTGNTAWMITATILVLLMSIPGIALFYGGLVRQKNVPSWAWSACCGWP